MWKLNMNIEKIKLKRIPLTKNNEMLKYWANIKCI